MNRRDILVAKKKGEKLKVNMKFGAPPGYCKEVNFKDFNDLALLFEDLELFLSAPIDKAYKKFKENKGENFPFY